MSPSPEQVIAGHRAALAQVRARVLAYAQTAWKAQGSYRDADIDRLVSLIAPRVTAGQVLTANLTSSYIATIASAQAGKFVKPSLVDEAAVTMGRGVAPDEVYRRPATKVYTSLAAGAAYPDAVAAGSLLLGQLVVMDMQMAQVRQTFNSYGDSDTRRYRRVTSGGACPLCSSASQRTYYVSELLPIHDNCRCTTAPLADGESPPSAPKRREGQPKPPEVGVRDHGEYGPTLVDKDQHFLDAAKIDTSRTVEQLQTTLTGMEEYAQRTGISSPFTRTRIGNLRAEIAVRG